jgi:DNA-binding MarR family transcriptional regulator
MADVKREQSGPSNLLEIADRLHSAAIHLLRQVRQQDTATREAPARLSALAVLVFGGPVTLGELAAAEQVKPPTMTRIVTGLERSRLAERYADPVDARKVKMRATAKGVRLLQQSRQRRIECVGKHLSALSPQELAALRQAADIFERWLHQSH